MFVGNELVLLRVALPFFPFDTEPALLRVALPLIFVTMERLLLS